MMISIKKAIVAAFLTSAVLARPAEAFTVSQKTAAVNGGATSLNASSQTYTAGKLIVAMGITRMASASDNIIVSGALSGGFTVFPCNQSVNNVTPTTTKSYIAYAPAAGGAEAISVSTSGAAATALFIQTIEVDGVNMSSIEDATVRACTQGSGTAPIVTSGTPSQASDLFMGVYGRAGNASGFSYTEDATNSWTQVGTVGGSTNVTYAASYVANLGIGTIPHQPTTTSANAAMAIIGFKAASSPPTTTPRQGLLLGVQN